jgi:hypothetical protein
LVLQTADDNLKNALQILALTDCAGNGVEQIEAVELRLELMRLRGRRRRGSRPPCR